MRARRCQMRTARNPEVDCTDFKSEVHCPSGLCLTNRSLPEDVAWAGEQSLMGHDRTENRAVLVEEGDVDIPQG
jgi:hypothetical protein